jgi:EAL domain-containing protein (putative c-di-GMP-specific phosphodiesterase class I)
VLGKRVVAEGIESAAQLERLRDFGCELGQGYYFARPLTPQLALALLSGDGAGGAAARPGEQACPLPAIA